MTAAEPTLSINITPYLSSSLYTSVHLRMCVVTTLVIIIVAYFTKLPVPGVCIPLTVVTAVL